MSRPAVSKPCPICGKPADAGLMPFCSPRCADVDLNRWLAGAYVVPGSPPENAEDAPAEAGDAVRKDDL